MKDYEVKLTITVPITACSQPQAEERAERLAERAIGAITRLQWVDEVGLLYGHEVEKIES